MCEDFQNEFRFNIGLKYFEYGLITTPLTALFFVIIIIIIHKKNPCKTKKDEVLYWIISSVMTLVLMVLTIGGVYGNE